MRNLQLLDSLSISDSTELAGCQALCVDYDTKVIYVVTGSSIYILDPSTCEVTEAVSLLDGGFLAADGSTCVVGAQHLPDQMSVCVATSAGDVLLWNTTTGEVENVGTVDSGLTAMAWSPDHELMVLGTGQQTLIMMTRDFDPVIESPMHPAEFGEAEFVTVGWGKKETQFHGSVGKQAAQQKTETVSTTTTHDDGCPRISWRGDGQYFVVSSISSLTGGRVVRVWTRECTLHSTNETTSGLQHTLAWKPSGSVIAVTRTLEHEVKVTLFERNGLRHGEFLLPFSEDKVKVREVLWNTESSILAVWCEECSQEGGTCSYVDLWTVGNYHWYSKQSLQFNTHQVAAVTWDPEHPHRLHLVCDTGQYIQYTWTWATAHSRGTQADDMTIAAVIDGDRLLMTPFRHMLVPPPLCSYHLQLPAPISHVTFAPPPDSNDIAILLADGRLVIYRFTEDPSASLDPAATVKLEAAGGNGFNTKCRIPSASEIYSVECDSVLGDLAITHLLWMQPDWLLVCTRNITGSGSCLYSPRICADTRTIKLGCAIDVVGRVMALCSNNTTKSVAVELINGEVLEYSPETFGVLSPWPSAGVGVVGGLCLPQPCPHLALTSLAGEQVLVGLTDRFRLYINNTEVASNCTSFAIHEDFLLLTTHAHTCRCIPRTTQLQAVMQGLAEGKAHPFDESVRRVERGSRIVCIVPDDTQLILQMPRGNLETIHPRALVLSVVRKHLNRMEYKTAFLLMRKHRINMNLIHDHDPESFMKNVTKFVEDISVVSHINLFLTDLLEEDVTATMYTVAYTRDPVVVPPGGVAVSKVDRICRAARIALEQLNSNKYLLSILTTYVKQSTPRLEEALHLVRGLRQAGTEADSVSAEAGGVSAEGALKYLLFLVDVNELYNVALGTYDFDLVLMVAEKSQKDPKEYLPFLNELRRLEPDYQRYSIDLHLRRYTHALAHIAKCGDEHFSECMNLIKDHKLHAQALRLFTGTSSEYKEIAINYAEFLKSDHRPQEAGIMFAKAGDHTRALPAFEESLNWQQAMCMASLAKLSQEETLALGRRLAASLSEQRRTVEAAVVLELYVGDVEEAIVCLVDGGQWDDALTLMYRHSRPDFIESNLLPALRESCAQHQGLMETTQEQFKRHTQRLQVVRQNKEKERLEFLEGGGDYNVADADLFSDTSSATGDSVSSFQSSRRSTTSGSQRSSKMSGKSAKNKRKAERKKWSLKEGSRHEDLALLDSLSKICTQAHSWREDVGRLLRALVQFHMEPQAEALQAQLDSLILVISISQAVIWPPQSAGLPETSFGPDSTANTISQALQGASAIPSLPPAEALLMLPPPVLKDMSWKLHSLLPYTS